MEEIRISEKPAYIFTLPAPDGVLQLNKSHPFVADQGWRIPCEFGQEHWGAAAYD